MRVSTLIGCADAGREQQVCDPPTLCAEWPRSSCEVIRIHLDRFTIDLRFWAQADEQAPLKPTHAGLVVSIKHLAVLHQAVTEALARAQGAGLIPAKSTSS